MTLREQGGTVWILPVKDAMISPIEAARRQLVFLGWYRTAAGHWAIDLR